MANNDGSTTPGGQELNREFVAALQWHPDFLPLPAENAERNEAIHQEYGVEAQALTIGGDGRIWLGDRSARISAGRNGGRLLLNCAFQQPDAWVSTAEINRYGGGSGITTVANRLSDNLGKQNLFSRLRRGTGHFLRLSPNIELYDQRDQASIPLPVHLPYPFTGPEGLPTSETPNLPEIDLFKVRPAFDDNNLINSTTPHRFARILNPNLVNRRTEAQLKAINQKHPDRPAVQPNRLVIFDDQHAEINGLTYEVGPLPTRVMHQLLRQYFEGFVDVKKLVLTDIAVDYLKVEGFMQRLAMQGVIFAEGKPVVRRATLKPILIDDRRPAPVKEPVKE